MVMLSNIIHVRATGALALSETFTPAGEVELLSVRLHLSAAGGAAENYVITIDSGTATAYDVALSTSAMAALADVTWIPDTPLHIQNGDEVDFTYTNSNARTWGLEYVYRKLY